MIAILICAAITALVACGNKETVEEKPMENGPEIEVSITVQGMVGERCVVNPAFLWSSTQQNAKYTFRLTDASGEVIGEGTGLSATSYEVSNALAGDREYVFSVTETESGAIKSVTIRTVDASPDLESATITLADPYKSHMVIQRDRRIALKGSTTPYVLLSTDYFGTRCYAVSDEAGAFDFTLPAVAANATPTDIEIGVLAGSSVTLEDVLVGDVYLASGQSNMWWKLRDSDYDETVDVDNAVNSDLRYFSMSITQASSPREQVTNGKWSAISRANTSYKDYSAVAFMTASMLASSLKEKGVPVGIVVAAQGDTNIVNWMGKEYYDGTIGTKNQNYNAMIHPLQGGEFRGVIWYQGCNNSAKGSDYKGLLKGLMANWRTLFRNETLPFYIVQLPCYDGDSGNNYDFSFVRESQAMACAEDANAYLIATCDGGDPGYIHPTEKRYICERLTKSILSTIYGENYLPQGPTYKSHVTQGNRAIITVDNGDGLAVKSGEAIRGFMLAGADGKYFDATATIADGKIVVTSNKVAAPVYVKYGFTKSPFLNIYNKDGYLMSPFRTDAYNRNIDLLDYREGAQYRLNGGGSTMTYEVVGVDGEVGLRVTKTDENGDKGYGILELDKWGAIGYNELDVEISVMGANSGAELAFRIIEGSGEVWSIGMTDDFVGKRTVTVPTSLFRSNGTASDGVLDYQKVKYVDLVIRKAGTVSVTVLGVRFVETERTAPRDFTISEARNDGHEVLVRYTQAGFAEQYRVIVSTDGDNFTRPVYDDVTEDLQVTFDPARLESNTPYYVKVVALNELGVTVATNSGFVIASIDRNGVADFTFDSDAAFESYRAAKISNVHSKLALSRSEKGLKVNVKERDGWMDFIVNFTKGANKDYDTLKLYLDLTEYKGSGLMIQLQDEGGNSYSYSVSLGSRREGYFEIPLTSFKKGEVAFDGHDLIRLKFGITDYVGGSEDNLYIDDIEFIKV